ncbi:5303_t:CDS:2, partial [Entrophospora sp. SA101]
MVYFSFSGDLEEPVKQKFEFNYFNLAVIPGGCTSICQPLDFSINKPFKDHLRRDGGNGGVTAGVYLRRAYIKDDNNVYELLEALKELEEKENIED